MSRNDHQDGSRDAIQDRETDAPRAAGTEEGFSNLLTSLESGEGWQSPEVELDRLRDPTPDHMPDEGVTGEPYPKQRTLPEAGAPESASEDGAAAPVSQAPQSRTEALCAAITADIDKAVAAIIGGEFSDVGSGNIGNLFRLMKTLEGPEHVGAWSNLLELAETLWARDKQEAALELMKAANISLSAPDIFAERVSEAIENAQNYVYAERADKRFDEGDHEGAAGIAQNLTGPLGEEYREELTLRHKARRRSRIMAFGFSSVAIVALVAVAVSGVSHFRDYLKNPPRIELPEMPRSQVWEDLKKSRLTREAPPPVKEIMDAEAEKEQPPAPESVPEPAPEAKEKAEPQASSAPMAQQDPASFDQEVPASGTDDKDPEEATPATTPRTQEAPRPSAIANDAVKDPSSEVIYNCALGQAVSRRAIEIVVASGEKEGADIVEKFVEKVNSACASLSVAQSDIDKVIASIPSSRIDTMAQNILRTGR